MDPERPKRPPSIAQLSKTPSWVMLGFILGALFIWALPTRVAPPRPIMVAAPPETTRVIVPRPLTIIEAVFDKWSEYAVWDNDTTQVALWNSTADDFAEFYEIRRLDGGFYYRSIPALTNRIIRHGKAPPPECPLRFTETEEQYREWRQQGRFERPAENPRPSLSVERVAPPTPQPSLERSKAPVFSQPTPTAGAPSGK